ncbi:nucleoside 2-deoxyribosyltransferase [Flammeovirga sp. SJP92]|uniref:nucleoside 2-deoxyribosyltransferase n=1 Tax=Flammeovirga sp. SJP92 TaxID=1775430 RepID=UPI000787D60B|nr:nucleoside 2-deoxyribosyltransferase [Flammeovirga sp. SJP92]KXX69634.1 hypothetical protein AVL50_15345 [Flammeovirga sp. SJP92]
MKKAYLGISFSNRKRFDNEINTLKEILQENNYELFVFVDQYRFQSHQEKKMMETAFKEIESSDLFIAELTHKAIGVGLEVGYAHAKNIPIIYIRQKGSEYSTTVAGCAEAILEYENETDLKQKIDPLL